MRRKPSAAPCHRKLCKSGSYSTTVIPPGPTNTVAHAIHRAPVISGGHNDVAAAISLFSMLRRPSATIKDSRTEALKIAGWSAPRASLCRARVVDILFPTRNPLRVGL